MKLASLSKLVISACLNFFKIWGGVLIPPWEWIAQLTKKESHCLYPINYSYKGQKSNIIFN